MGAFPFAQRWRVVAAVFGAGVAFGCHSDPEPEVAPGPTRVYEVTLPSGLVQRVEVRPETVKQGNLVSIRSTLINATDAPIELQSKICSLKFETEMAWTRPFPQCAGYSSTEELVPDDWVTVEEEILIQSPPGMYELLVIHALHPPGFIEVTLEVVPWFYPSQP